MRVQIFKDKPSLARVAADQAAAAIRHAIDERSLARVVAATGVSQFDFLEALTQADGIDWGKIELFHLDEYIGLPITHPASFRKFLLERLVGKTGIKNFHPLDGDAPDPAAVALRVGNELNAAPVDVAFVGIGENGHLAFNDPPADFQTEQPYIIVNLDEACRRQQVGEGWFGDLAAVPKQALSMSVRQILKAREIIVVAPEARKAAAVKACLEGEITPMLPGSILRTHANTTLYLDQFSAGMLSEKVQSSILQGDFSAGHANS
ncbi:MAG TPA: glucosamine-6-phosphate deaminase [Terriglobales bacterium]|nr:glucosamine-6-phosphate deaminase [Terriglobales bacterium]